MEITQRKRSGKKNHTVNKSEVKANINFDINTFKALANYCVSSNKNIRRSHLVMIRNMIASMNMDLFLNEPDKRDYIYFMNKAIENRIKYGNNLNRDLLIQGALDATSQNRFQSSDFAELPTSDLEYLNELVSNALKRSYIETYADEMIRIGTAIKSQNYLNQDQVAKEFEDFIRNSMTYFRGVSMKSLNNTIFDLRADKFSDTIDDIHDRLSASYRRLYTGMQGFNMLLGDYFEATRVYLLLGTAGVGKSMTLLDIMLQIKKFNPNYVGKDPTKIPTVLYLTQENDVDETVDRIFSMVSGGGRMKDYTKQQIKDILINQGELFLSDESNINIMIMYKPNASIDTGDLYTIAEELEDDGYELIMLLQDHVKRIHSVYMDHRADLRLELGDIINEFKVFAQMKQIPVVTVAHLNRSANATIENAQAHNTADITKLLGRSNVGESLLMIDNADLVLLINAEYDKDGHKYLGLNQLKIRYAAQPPRTYLAIPYDPDSPAKLMTDFGEVPLFKFSLMETPNNNTTIKSRTQKTIFGDEDLDNEEEYVQESEMDETQKFFASSMPLISSTIPPLEMFHGTSYDEESATEEPEETVVQAFVYSR